ncbi:MAG: hypothetical protein ACP5HG_16510 [Anaerolineae bacterium]
MSDGERRVRILIAACVCLGLVAILAACVGWPAPRPTEVVPSASPSPTPSPQPTLTGTPAATPTTEPPTPTASLTPSPSETPTPTPSASATATATPTPTPTRATPSPTPHPSADGPVIHTFEASPEVADPGDTVALSWASVGATRATIYKLFYSGQLPAEGIDVPPTGTMTYTIAEDETNWVNFLLWVWDDQDRHASAGATVELRCRYAWFFSPPPEEICPTAPLISQAAEQHFELGTMIWVEAEDAIYVLYGEEAVAYGWDRFTDKWDESEPDRDPDLTPSPGRQQPIRGFGLVWREHPYVREHLGWALAEEQGFTTVMQRTTRYKYNAWYLLAQDGMIWYLGPERSRWDKLWPEEVALP